MLFPRNKKALSVKLSVKKSGAIFILFVMGVLAACDARQSAPATPLPDNPEGKLLFINYWAEWCKPCREEIPELNSFMARNADTVAVYGVNFDGLKGDALAQVETRMGVNFPTLAVDPGVYLGLQAPGILPVTLVVNEKEEVVAQLVGEQTLQTLEETLFQLLPDEASQ